MSSRARHSDQLRRARAKGAFEPLSAEIAAVAETAVVGEQVQDLFTVVRAIG